MEGVRDQRVGAVMEVLCDGLWRPKWRDGDDATWLRISSPWEHLGWYTSALS